MLQTDGGATYVFYGNGQVVWFLCCRSSLELGEFTGAKDYDIISVSAKLTCNFVLFFTIGPYQQQPPSVLRVRVGRRVGDAGNGGVSAPARRQYPRLVVHEGSRRG
jgi:hypothetical protein